MAPEALLGKPLNEKSDVYSFGICLWEIVIQKEPFPPDVKINFQTFLDAVCYRKVRPSIPPDIHHNLRDLLEKCWQDHPSLRPSFQGIIEALNNIIVDVAVSDPVGNEMWKQYFSGKSEVIFQEFFKAMKQTLNIRTEDLPNIEYFALRELFSKKK